MVKFLQSASARRQPNLPSLYIIHASKTFSKRKATVAPISVDSTPAGVTSLIPIHVAVASEY